jgi:branched-chain amino acid transport system substrate-binding protein
MRHGLTVCVLVGVLASTAMAQDNGVAADKIVVGQSAALEGPASSLGLGMQSGLRAAIAEINAKGGVKNRKIELISVNDSYEPEQCVKSTKKLIEGDKVFLLIGGVGTPTSKVAVPLAEAAGVPFVAPFTGAELLRAPFNKFVVNYRASYYQETEELAKHLVDKLGMKKIACFYQDDSYGQAGLTGMKLALERRKMTLCATGKYERNTVAVGPGLAAVTKGQPEAIVMIGAYKPCAEFIKQAKAQEATKGATFCNISFVGTGALSEELAGNDGNCIVSQVVPFPWDESLALVKSYQAAMKSAGQEAQIGYVSLEGYIAGRMLAAVLEKLDGDPTRAKFLAQVDKMGAFEIDGVKLSFGPTDHQASDQVFLTSLEGGKILPLTK